MFEIGEFFNQNNPLPLTTPDNRLRVVFLGVGSAFCKRNRQSNILLIQGDHHVLIDCGTQGPLALHDVGLDVYKVQCYLPTHSHSDHIGGFEEVALCNRYSEKAVKPKMIVLRDYQEILWSKSLAGGAEYCEANEGQSLQISDFFEILRPKPMQYKGRKSWVYKHGPLEILIARTRHFPDSALTVDESQWCCGVFINNSVWISGDTMFDPEYPDRFADAAEVMFHDCQLYKGGVHASYEELMTLPPAIRKKMILYHFGDEWDEPGQWKQSHHSFAGDPVPDGFLGWAEPCRAYDFF